jgi:hypothetical protein
MPDFTVWYRLDRALQLGCCDYDQAVSATTADGVEVTGRLRFEAVGCAK